MGHTAVDVGARPADPRPTAEQNRARVRSGPGSSPERTGGVARPGRTRPQRGRSVRHLVRVRGGAGGGRPRGRRKAGKLALSLWSGRPLGSGPSARAALPEDRYGDPDGEPDARHQQGKTCSHLPSNYSAVDEGGRVINAESHVFFFFLDGAVQRLQSHSSLKGLL